METRRDMKEIEKIAWREETVIKKSVGSLKNVGKKENIDRIKSKKEERIRVKRKKGYTEGERSVRKWSHIEGEK